MGRRRPGSWPSAGTATSWSSGRLRPTTAGCSNWRSPATTGTGHWTVGSGGTGGGGGCDITREVARLLPDGTLDTSFGDGGTAAAFAHQLDCTCTAGLAIAPNGTIVAAAAFSSQTGVAAFTPSGRPDHAFA